jgi:dienelactone hydrolase
MAKVSIKVLFYGWLSCLMAVQAVAEVQTRTIPYQHGSTELQGYLAWDDRFDGKRPGVLVVHEWWGLNDYARARARQLAEQGYVAFAPDMYGTGKVTSHPDQAGAWMKEIKENVDRWVDRAGSGLAVLQQQAGVDSRRLAAIGYCFGGATVMHMAYAGLDVDLVASFHGSLPVAADSQLPAIKAKILVAHGNADPFVPAERVGAFRDALAKSDADWTMMEFGGVKHSFTNPGAGDYGIDALVYDQQADQQSWQMLLWLLDDTFKK